ncbi:hypothetical protein [Streptomyces nodosus]|nr:hypothetical protein [Streptomyces nodosus]MBB4796109.1 hypothetical protein [Streptomyces nodosus]
MTIMIGAPNPSELAKAIGEQDVIPRRCRSRHGVPVLTVIKMPAK